MTGIKLREGFGQTETTLTVVTLPWIEPKPGSMGLPNPQYNVDIITSDGKVADVGEHGQIIIRTDKKKPLGLFKEYYKDKEKTDAVWNNDIYYTGDIAWCRKTVGGAQKDVILYFSIAFNISAGVNFSWSYTKIFWFSMLGLHKLGAIAIPATHLLTDKDIIYRNNANYQQNPAVK